MKKLRKNSGVVLLMTLVIVTVLALVGGSILFSSLNQGTSTQASVDDIKAEELAKGIMWKKNYDGSYGSSEPAERIGDKVCTPIITEVGDKKTIKVSCR